jgi:ubiquinone biosynthesis protein
MHNIVRDFRSTRGYLRVFPKMFHDILKALKAGKHHVEIQHSGFQQTNAKIERGINRLTVGLVISASLIAGSLVLDSSQKVIEFSLDIFGVSTISITALLGLLGYSLATILGFWLIISIFRSGKM